MKRSTVLTAIVCLGAGGGSGPATYDFWVDILIAGPPGIAAPQE